MGILPKLNDTPNYTMTIPSTGETIGYRPYLVKEEKVMLMANETGDQKQVMEAMANTIRACCDEKVDVPTLTTFDVEYMFTQIRAKSVGETTEVNAKCSAIDCDHATPVTINLTEAEVDMSESPKDNLIQLTDDISVEVRYPTYKSVYENMASNEKEDINQVDFAFKMLEHSLVAVVTEDERILVSEATQKERKEFIDSMTNQQFESIGDYMNKMPTLGLDMSWTCESCSHENKYRLEGLQDFFT